MLWTTGGIFTGAGTLVAIIDHPLVPLSYVFHVLPIGVGGAIALAILRERFGSRWVIGYGLLLFWLTYTVFSAQTTFAPVMLAAGIFPLTRALIKTMAELEG